MRHSRWLLTSVRTSVAVVAVAVLAFVTPLSIGVRLLADTLLVMGGNDNPDGIGMSDELDGYLNSSAPNYGFPGYTFNIVPWNAQLFASGSSVDAQQRDGVTSILNAIDAAYIADAQARLAVVGYSSSADVVIRAIRELDARGAAAPSSDRLRFLVFASPDRLNGGLFTRIPGLHIPIIGATFDGSGNPDTDYALTDIAWKYDPIADFPKYPLNLLAFGNALLGFTNHGDYSMADVANAIVDPNMTGTAPDGTTYISIAPEHLPLLQPLYQLGVPARLLDAITPALTVLVELGYDRSTPVWESSRVGLAPPLHQVLAAVPAFAKAVLDGVSILAGKPPAVSTPATTVADVLAAPTQSATLGAGAPIPGSAESKTMAEPKTIGESKSADESKVADEPKVAHDAVLPDGPNAVDGPKAADRAPAAEEPKAVEPKSDPPSRTDKSAQAPAKRTAAGSKAHVPSTRPSGRAGTGPQKKARPAAEAGSESASVNAAA